MPRLAKKLEEELLNDNPKLRAEGLRPVVIWVPDTDRPEFQESLRQEIEAIRDSPEEQEILDWLEQVSDWPKD
jgi:hypothetical protein